jgi:hypothetical protein
MSDTPETPAGDGADDKGPIPYERFAATRRELADAKARATAAETAAAAATKAAEQYAAQVAAAAAEAAALASRHDRYRTSVGAGLTDPDVIAAAEWAYDRHVAAEPDAAKRPTYADALTGWRAKPEEAPLVLRPFLATANGSPPPSNRTPRADPAPPTTPTGVGGAYTPDRIDELRRTGQYAAHRDAIMASMRGGPSRT